MLVRKDNITSDFLPYAVCKELAKNPDKYEGRKKNAYESLRRLSKLPLIQAFSNSICLELGISQVNLKPTGSAKAGYANEKSDLDIYIKIDNEHPLNIVETRKIYAMKMQFLLNTSKNIDFLVYITFVTN